MFERILAARKADPLVKYASTYEGKLPTDLATIEEGIELVKALAVAALSYRGGLGLPEPKILAIGGRGGRNTLFIPAMEMADAGFPKDKPIHLFLKYEFGRNLDRSDVVGDEETNPHETAGAILLEVCDTAYQIAEYGDRGYKLIFDQISAAQAAGGR